MSDPQQPEPQQPEPQNPRPKPQYGEYAPEGWEWKPNDAAPAAAAAPTGEDAARVAGVPHNLGAGTDAGSRGPARAQAGSPRTSTGDPAPYRAAPPQTPAQSVSPASPQGPAPSAQKSRVGDRVVTILLLAVGAFGALSTAQSMMGLAPSFVMIADALGIDDFTVPDWVGILGTVSAIVIFAIYAVVLIFSIRRMRAHKLTFWVPLSAGAAVVIAVTLATTLVLVSMPDLVGPLMDPSATQQLLEYLGEMPQ